MISALRGGSGKTILSIGIIAALCRRGKTVSPFKKGPDYIDAGWLALAAGRPCFNLDTFMVPPACVLTSFLSRSSHQAIAVIEGNRGLYDGIDIDGTTSTAELAKLLQTPVLMCIDATKTTRTMAAVVSGCEQFDRDVPLKGVILNRVAGARHENILRRSIEAHCGIPVLGAVPKLSRQNFPERHMGLVPTPEHPWARDVDRRHRRDSRKTHRPVGSDRYRDPRAGPPTTGTLNYRRHHRSRPDCGSRSNGASGRHHQRFGLSILLSGKYRGAFIRRR